VGISIVFEIFSNFPFLLGGADPRGNILCTAYIAYNTRNKNIYGSGLGISRVFNIISNFPFLGGGADSRIHI
jgi:hypothetical protein